MPLMPTGGLQCGINTQSISALCMRGDLLSVQKWILFEDALTHVLVFNSPFQLMT